MSAMTALEHVNRDDINCVTVAVDRARIFKSTCDWRLDRDIVYHRSVRLFRQLNWGIHADCNRLFIVGVLLLVVNIVS